MMIGDLAVSSLARNQTQTGGSYPGAGAMGGLREERPSHLPRGQWREVEPKGGTLVHIPLTETEKLVLDLKSLGTNWDGEGSESANWKSIDLALGFLQYFRGLSLDWGCGLHADGRAMLDAHSDVGRAYIIFGSDHKFMAFAAPHGEVPSFESFSLSDLGQISAFRSKLVAIATGV